MVIKGVDIVSNRDIVSSSSFFSFFSCSNWLQVAPDTQGGAFSTTSPWATCYSVYIFPISSFLSRIKLSLWLLKEWHVCLPLGLPQFLFWIIWGLSEECHTDTTRPSLETRLPLLLARILNSAESKRHRYCPLFPKSKLLSIKLSNSKYNRACISSILFWCFSPSLMIACFVFL